LHCYQHRDAEALAICRTCGRGVCAACSHEGPEGITCSGDCQTLAKAVHEMNLRALRIYGIGEKPRRITVPIVAWLLPGLVFMGFGAISSWRAGTIDTTDAFGLTLGAVFVAAGVWMHLQARRLQQPGTETKEARAP
jgi:hypothetical protein